MQLILLFALFLSFSPNLGIAGDSMTELRDASDEEREQCLAEITPEQEEQFESELAEEVRHTVGPVKIEETDLKEPRGVTKICKQLFQRVHCEKTKRSKEVCVELKAQLEKMTVELSSASPEEMNEKAKIYRDELVKIVKKMNKRKSVNSRRVGRGINGEIFCDNVHYIWRKWFLKALIKEGIEEIGDNIEDNWRGKRFGKFAWKLLGSIFGITIGTIIVGVFEWPVKVVMTLYAAVVAILFGTGIAH